MNISNSLQNITVSVIGNGNMGSALISAIEKSGAQVMVFNRETDKAGALNSDVVIFAVKPKDIELSVEEVKLKNSDTVFQGNLWSVAAAPNIRYFEEKFPEAKVVRLMPNTPVKVGAGAVGVVISERIDKDESAAQFELIENLLGGCGKIVRLNDESALAGLTAISGSAPAYFFAFTEALAKAGEELGIDPEISSFLAQQSLIGAANLLEGGRNEGETPKTLREAVTSPGGTTEQALKSFENDSLNKVVFNATKSCFDKFVDMQ